MRVNKERGRIWKAVMDWLAKIATSYKLVIGHVVKRGSSLTSWLSAAYSGVALGGSSVIRLIPCIDAPHFLLTMARSNSDSTQGGDRKIGTRTLDFML
jgi:hypothetical protein